ncbi:chitinase, partial [Mitsuaria sp. GD03876]|uniref:chitinase n=1 Tax=Mitsuaria sp. GD03876 TaxID=2975399 RepID=UPI002449124C
PGTPPSTTPDPTPGTPPGTTPDPTPGTPPGTTPDPAPGTPPEDPPSDKPSLDISIDKLPPRPEGANPTLPRGTPIVPPVIATEAASVLSAPAPSGETGSALPATGYAFLRQVTAADWNWLFPLRAGRHVEGAGKRNAPPFATRDGAKDVFTLEAFQRAVLEYNRWAQVNGYKQFLNEGTRKQQGQEFVAFWAKASRETSGTWAGAPAPWIERYRDRHGVVTSVWKGALHRAEQAGYSTAADGSSPALGYIDPASRTYPAVPGRSYHGRGIVQLSWNYNYGAFSAWLHDHGLMRDVVTSRDTLLARPDLLATHGPLSMLSGIWFWMTPQGAMPSSHDVLYGDVTKTSAGGHDPGLPALRIGVTVGGQTVGPVAAGDTSDEGVMAYRLGTLTNIFNGGLECNSVGSWHPGAAQRISYYNAYATYFNEKLDGLGVTRVSKATDIWTARISSRSDETVQSATCFNQKAYYAW